MLKRFRKLLTASVLTLGAVLSPSGTYAQTGGGSQLGAPNPGSATSGFGSSSATDNNGGLPSFSNLRGGAPAREIDDASKSGRVAPSMPDPDALRVDANATSPLPGNSSQAKGLDSSPAADGYSSAAAARRANGLPYTPAHGAGSYSSPRYIPQVPSFQSGNSPRAGTPNNKAPFDKGLNPYYQSRQPVSNADSETLGELEAIAEQATKSSGAIFKDPENVIVKPPLLSALITLEKTRSPYQLDADSASNVTLRDVLRTALESNLDIKIAGQDELAKKWAMVGAFSGFLPNITNEANVEGLGGQYVSPAGLVIPIHNPFFTTTSGFNWTLFKGGGILANYRQYKHSYKASAASAKGTINDVLDQVSNDFYNLVLNEVMLQIRVKQVQVTQALVLVDKDFLLTV